MDEDGITPIEITQGNELSQMFFCSWTMLFYERQAVNYQISRQDENFVAEEAITPSPSRCGPQNATFDPLRDIMNTNKLDVATCDLYEFAKRTTLPDGQNSPFIVAPTEP